MPRRSLERSPEQFSKLRPISLRFWPHQVGDDPHVDDPRHCVDANWDRAERDRVLAYLADCYESGFLVPSPLVWCAFGCLAPSPSGSVELTDGTWFFPEILTHYVQQHAVKPPSDFLTHIRRNGYRVPNLGFT
jgi:hypothetical protein